MRIVRNYNLSYHIEKELCTCHDFL